MRLSNERGAALLPVRHLALAYRLGSFLSIGFLLMASASLALAQASEEPAPRPGDQIGIHIVRPGETLSSITQEYLGVARLWRENQRLNPTVSEPNRLRVGQRLRVITHRPLPARSAEIVKVERDVEQQQAPRDWEPAQEGAELAEDDGIKTERRSSAELGFDDGTQLMISERSLVYVRRAGETLVGVKEQQIEIERGEADLTSAPRRAGSTEIEILVGGAVARPRPGNTGRVASRLRTTESGDAAVMVYDGESAVDAGGQSVAVATGMGTSIPEGQAPLPPEKLLSAPEARSPERGARLSYRNPLFRWDAIADAASYKIEICRDPGCGALVDIAADIQQTNWRPDAVLNGALYWRVRGISASGLDGYPSRSRPLTLDGPLEDLTPPAVAVRVSPPGRALSQARIVLGEGGALELMLFDDASGVESVRYRWQGGRWREWQRGSIEPPRTSGVYRIEIEATDRAGRTSDIVAVEVERQSEAPASPTARAGARTPGNEDRN